jgi:ribosomal protein S18 acetylase RimI-like enzyme
MANQTRPATVIIRKAAKQDMDTLLRFEQGVIQAERPFDVTLKKDPNSYYDIEEMLISPGIQLLVATLGDKIIGSGYARLETSKTYLRHSRHAYLGFMYVEPAFRGRGINQQIIAELKTWILSQNITEVRLDVYFNNENAIKAYQKAGFAKHMIQMRMDITPP